MKHSMREKLRRERDAEIAADTLMGPLPLLRDRDNYRRGDELLTRRQFGLVRRFDDVEQKRRELRAAEQALALYIDANAALLPAWEAFLNSGGTSGDLLHLQLRGRVRPTSRKVPRRGPVRLVVVNEPTPILGKFPKPQRAKQRHNDGPEAA